MDATQTSPPDKDQVISATRHWLERAVIGLNLCPFAKSVHVKNQIRYVVSGAQSVDELHEELVFELQFLQQADPDKVDTTLLIHPGVLTQFLDFNDFIGVADETASALGLEGEIQVASFHPDYQFADTSPENIGNYTNRSPYPTLHLIREASIDRAVAAIPDAHEIFERNIETMRRLGAAGWEALQVNGSAGKNNRKQ